MSSSEEKELKDLEGALARLVPQTPDLSRDRLLFAAGQARQRRVSWWLLAGNLLLVALSVYLGYLVWVRPLPPAEVRTVTVEIYRTSLPEPRAEEAAPQSEAAPPPGGVPGGSEYPPPYGTIQKRMPYLGVDALPPIAAEPEGASPPGEPARIGERPPLFDRPFLTFPGR